MATNLLSKLSIATVSTAAISLSILSANPAQAATITFDNVTNSQLDLIGNQYEGFNWTNFGVIKDGFYNNSGYNNGIVSGEYTGFNAWGQTATVSSNTLFDFNGAFLAAAWNNGLNIQVDGFRDGLNLFSKTVRVDTDAATWFDFNFLDIDRVSFTSFGGTDAGLDAGGNQLVIDNFTFNDQPTSQAVPEPGTIAALGLIGLGGLLTNKKLNASDN